jgi:hypothetical protein
MKFFLTTVVLFVLLHAQAQETFEVRLAATDNPFPITANNITHPSSTPVPGFLLTIVNPVGATYDITVNGNPCLTFTPGTSTSVSCAGVPDLRGANIQIRRTGVAGPPALTVQFTAPVAAPAGSTPPTPPGGTPARTFNIVGPQTEAVQIRTAIAAMQCRIRQTQFGMQILPEQGYQPNAGHFTQFVGKRYVHVFFDQFGNSVLGSIPQGISNLQYVIHVVYLTPQGAISAVRYVINKTSGEYNDQALYRNTGILDSTAGFFQFRNGPLAAAGPVNLVWQHAEQLFGTSTTNIGFTISRLKIEDFSTYQTSSTPLNSYTITMVPVYAGSFDIGMIVSQLKNPDYSLVNSPTDPNAKVVKEGATGNRGVVVVMATLYVSPFTILRSLVNEGSVPWYKLTGRSFLDYSGNIFDRIYPAIGVGFSDRNFENLFFGANIEVARGGNVFLGYHYGKVNVFNGGDGFKFGETIVTQDEFNLRKDTGWRGAFAAGATVDLRILLNLFRSGAGQ